MPDSRAATAASLAASASSSGGCSRQSGGQQGVWGSDMSQASCIVHARTAASCICHARQALDKPTGSGNMLTGSGCQRQPAPTLLLWMRCASSCRDATAAPAGGATRPSTSRSCDSTSGCCWLSQFRRCQLSGSAASSAAANCAALSAACCPAACCAAATSACAASSASTHWAMAASRGRWSTQAGMPGRLRASAMSLCTASRTSSGAQLAGCRGRQPARKHIQKGA